VPALCGLDPLLDAGVFGPTPRGPGWAAEGILTIPDVVPEVSRLKEDGVLYTAGSNRYIIAPAGTRSIRQAASPELFADLRSAPTGL
jgi:hypothetical protein